MKISASVHIVMVSLAMLFDENCKFDYSTGIAFFGSDEGARLEISQYGYLLDDDSYLFGGKCKVFCGLILVD
jgi:hypothetical protein